MALRTLPRAPELGGVFDMFRDDPAPKKPTAKARQARVTKGQKAKIIQVLREAYPAPVSGAEISKKTGAKNVIGRIFDLKQDGYAIEGDGVLGLAADGTQLYRLASLDEPAPLSPIRAGLKLVLREDGSLTVSGYTGTSDADLQDRLLRAVLAAADRVIPSGVA